MKEALKRRIRRTLAMHKLRNTKCRYAVLKQLIKNEKAMSHAELEANLELFDRVTIYRTINSFLEKGLVHRIMDGMGTMRYALCKAQCSPKEHKHEHVHFQCRKCGATECLSDHPIPSVSLPEGYTHAESNLLIQGLCKTCN